MDGSPDETWTEHRMFLWISQELGELKADVGELKADVKGLKKGFDNHLTQHFKISMALLGGFIALAVTGFYFFLRLVL